LAWKLLLVVVNLIAYSIGIFTVLRIAWPVFQAVATSSSDTTKVDLSPIRERCLRLGDYLAKIGMCLWAASGLFIPIWLTVADAGDIEVNPIILFLISQNLFGITASTLSYFIMTMLVVRYFYPRLLVREPAHPHEAEQLVAVNRRMWIYYVLAVSVPFAAVLMLIYYGMSRGLTLTLGIVGLAGFWLSFWLDRVIRDDLSALIQVVNPSGRSLAGAETSDSFLTGSRAETLNQAIKSTRQSS
jgi:hypothetical protein